MNELIEALRMIAEQTGVDTEVVFQAVEASLVQAIKKNKTAENVEAKIDRESGEYHVTVKKLVVDSVENPMAEISVADARKINANYQEGDICQYEVEAKGVSRIAAQNAKQIIVQQIHEAERKIIFRDYKKYEKEIVSGLIQRRERGENVYLNLGKIEALLRRKDQIKGEAYPMNKRLKAYVMEVQNGPRGPLMIVSRSHPDFIKRLFEQEVPEIHDGVVVIRSIAREAGSRSKVAVYSKDPMVDPLGACVGPSGTRVNTIVNELSGEKIDIVIWNEDPAKFISAALSPSEVDSVEVDPETQTASVVVPDHQLSLAIGKEGQNARLAARLTGYRIDIRSASQKDSNEEGEEYEYEYEFVEEEDDEDYDYEYEEVESSDDDDDDAEYEYVEEEEDE